jgi:hypothetical protein
MGYNAHEFRSATFQQTVARLEARHRFIRADRPQASSGVERVQQTILEECWKPAFARYLIPKQTGLRLDLERYLRYYNTEWVYTGRWTKGRTPEQVLVRAKPWHKRRQCVTTTRAQNNLPRQGGLYLGSQPGPGRYAALVAGASFSRHAQGGGFWPDGAGMPNHQRQAPHQPSSAPEPATAGG